MMGRGYHLQQSWPVQGSQRTLGTWYFVLMVLLQAFWIQLESRMPTVPFCVKGHQGCGLLGEVPATLASFTMHSSDLLRICRLVCRAICSQGSIFFLFQRFLLGWILGITGSLKLNKWGVDVDGGYMWCWCLPCVHSGFLLQKYLKLAVAVEIPMHETNKVQRRSWSCPCTAVYRCNLWYSCPLYHP